MSYIDALFISPLLIALTAAAFGTHSWFRTKQPWLHGRWFGLFAFLVQAPTLMHIASADGLDIADAPFVVVPYCLVACAVLARRSHDRPGECRWRTLGAWLMAVAALGFVVLAALFVSVLLLHSSDAIFTLLLPAALPVFVLPRMWSAGAHCLRDGAAPPPRPVEGSLTTFGTFLSVTVRILTSAHWAGCAAMLVTWSETDFGGFRFVLVPPSVAAALWALVSALREALSPPPDVKGERPVSF